MEKNDLTTPGKRKKPPGKRVENYFRKYENSGTELYVDGERVSPSQAADYAVREECHYMADYILGEQGEIRQIRLDKVDLQ